MKKIARIALVLSLLAVVGYISLIVLFEGARFDISDKVQYNVERHEIELPWYLQIGTSYWGAIEGTDAQGRQYTWFGYEYPAIFESSELNCVVSWEDRTAIAYIGESRGMDIIYVEFPDVAWE